MRTLCSLFRKEWRDLRGHLGIGACVALAVSLGLRHFVFGWAKGGDVESAAAIAVVLVALLTAGPASDLVAGEVATRRIETLAALPVPLGDVWRAKALALAVAATAAAAFVVASNWMIVRCGIGGQDADRLLDALLVLAPWLSAAVALGAATLFFSTLLERGFAAFMAATATLVGLGAAVELADLPYVSFTSAAVLRLALPLCVAAAFVVASRLAFVHGGLHLGRKLRPALIGVSAAAALLLPAGAALAAWTSTGAVDRLDGFSDQGVSKSPDGKWTAGAARRGDERVVWIEDSAGRRRIVASGSVELATAGAGAGAGAWTVDSNLCVIESLFSWTSSRPRTDALTIEPSRLGVVERSRTSER